MTAENGRQLTQYPDKAATEKVPQRRGCPFFPSVSAIPSTSAGVLRIEGTSLHPALGGAAGAPRVVCVDGMGADEPVF